MATPVTAFKIPGVEPDVKICTPNKTFLLHSQILRLCSQWFAASMSDVWWKTETNIDGYRYCYDFDCDEDGFSTLIPRREEEEEPFEIPTPESTIEEPKIPGDTIEETTQTQDAPEEEETPEKKTTQTEEEEEEDPENTTEEDDPEFTEKLFTAYEDMFKSFYRIPLSLQKTSQCTFLITIADQFGAMISVRESARACTLDWDNLEQRIASEPIEFLIIGYKLESYRIFKDAFIHLVGKQCGVPDPSVLWWEPTDLTIPPRVLPLFKSECNRINRLLYRALREFNRIKPDEFGVGIDNVTWSSIYECFQTNRDPGREGALFREILRLAGNLTGNGKAYIESLSEPLGKSNLNSRVEEPHLSCAYISVDDLPWKRK